MIKKLLSLMTIAAITATSVMAQCTPDTQTYDPT